jgi:hypothetical protein
MAKAKTAIDRSGKVKPKGKPRGKPMLENLKPWQPGQSGNPGGEPRGEKFETTLSRYLERDSKEVARLASVSVTDPTKLEGISFQDALVLRTLAAYYNDPNGAFFTTLRETKEGKLVDKSEGNQTLKVKVTYDRDDDSTTNDQPTPDANARDAGANTARG